MSTDNQDTSLDNLLAEIEMVHLCAQIDESRGQTPGAVWFPAKTWGTILAALRNHAISAASPEDTLRELGEHLGVRGTTAIFRESLRIAREAAESVRGVSDDD